MCLACGNVCCASGMSEGCGCDHCGVSDCWPDYEWEDDGEYCYNCGDSVHVCTCDRCSCPYCYCLTITRDGGVCRSCEAGEHQG